MKTFIVSFSFVLSFAATIAQEGKVNFSKAYQRASNGKATVEIHEVKELVHIMIAVTKFGLGNDDMVQQQGGYYQDVLKHFKPFFNEPILATFDSLLQENPINYVFLSGNAISYDFVNDSLVANHVFLLPADKVSKFAITTNPITTYKAAIEQFARKADFRQFYAAHKPFYDSLIADYAKNANLKKQWQWLERNFTTRVNSYQVLCSPLINGLNYTGTFKSGDFTLIQMVLPPIDHNPKWSANLTEAINTRGMLTEVDHNYVSKPSDQYEKEINEALKDRAKWVDTKTYGTEYYQNPVKVFNEYMTFAVYLLYCEDIFKKDPATLKAVYADVNGVMSQQRGFIKMKEFGEQLVALRKAHKKKRIEDLYPALLEWCKGQ